MSNQNVVRITVNPDISNVYPTATTCANIVPADHTPGDKFPLAVHELELDNSGDMLTFKRDKENKPIIKRMLCERYTPAEKKTMCGLRGAYPANWLLPICHALIALNMGNTVSGRVSARIFAENWHNNDSLGLQQLAELDKLLLVEFSADSSRPATMGNDNSAWVVSMGVAFDYALMLSDMVTLADSWTEQTVKEKKTAKKTASKPVEFEL